MSIPIELSWPENIPLPLLDYSGSDINATVFSPEEMPATKRRSRYQKNYASMAVTWMLTTAEYEDFRIFFQDDLGSGTAILKMELRYPKNSALTEWAVRFGSGYEVTPMEGMWQIAANLFLLGSVATAVPAMIVGFSSFFVESETPGGEPELFIVLPDSVFNVEEN